MTEYKNVKEALKDLYWFNSATVMTQDQKTGKNRLAEAKDIQELNLDVIYQLADLLGVEHDELEAPEAEWWD